MYLFFFTCQYLQKTLPRCTKKILILNHNAFLKWQIIISVWVYVCVQMLNVFVWIWLYSFHFTFPCFHGTAYNFGTVISAWGWHLQIIWDPVTSYLFSSLLSKLGKAQKCHGDFWFSFGSFFSHCLPKKRTQVNGKECQSRFAAYLKNSWSGNNYWWVYAVVLH